MNFLCHLGFIYAEFLKNMDPHDWLKCVLTLISSNIFTAGLWWSGVELHAIYRGLSLASEMNLHKVICYLDSLHCVNILMELTHRYHKYATLILNIKNILNLDWITIIAYTHYEGNSFAYFLAKLGATSFSNLMIPTSHPLNITNFLVAYFGVT